MCGHCQSISHESEDCSIRLERKHADRRIAALEEQLRRANDDANKYSREANERYANEQRLEEQLRVVREALGEAGVILEVLRGQIVRRPYAEMTGEFQDSIIEASEKVRDAIRKPVQEHQK